MIFTRKYGTALSGGTLIWIPLLKASSDDFAGTGDWTPAATDVKISKDGGAQANLATTPSWDANVEMWKFTLSATELQCKQATVQIRDAAAKAVQDDGFIIETFGSDSAMYPQDVGATDGGYDVTFSGTPTATGGTVDVNVGSDIRRGELRLTSGDLNGETLDVTHTGTTIAALHSLASLPTRAKQFSAAIASGVTARFTPR